MNNITKLIIPGLALFVAEVLVGIAVFFATPMFPLLYYGVPALGAVVLAAGLVSSIVIALVLAWVVVALVDISESILRGEQKKPLQALMSAYKERYYSQVAVVSVGIAVLIWLLGSVHSLLGFLAAGVLYPVLVVATINLAAGSSPGKAVGDAVDTLLNYTRVDIAVLIVVFVLGLLSRVILLDIFVVPLLVLYLTFVYRSSNPIH